MTKPQEIAAELAELNDKITAWERAIYDRNMTDNVYYVSGRAQADKDFLKALIHERDELKGKLFGSVSG